MNTKKILALAMCAVLLVVSTVFVTVAFLTSQDEVKNTFTVGNVAIALDEAPVDVDGQAVAGDRVKANGYKLIPGKLYDKDPIVHVKGNEKCYLFIKVENGLATSVTVDGVTYNGIEAATTIENQILTNGWKKLSSEGTTTIYYFGAENDPTAVDPGENGVDVPVFATFKVGDNITNDVVAKYDGKNVNVTAYAIQADGLENDKPTELWNKLVPSTTN